MKKNIEKLLNEVYITGKNENENRIAFIDENEIKIEE